MKISEEQPYIYRLSSLGVEAQRGNMVNQFVPNYAAILAPAIDSISQALIGSGGPQEYTDASYNTAPDSRSYSAKNQIEATK